MSSTVSSIGQQDLAAYSTGLESDEAPLRAAAGIGLAVLLSIPLWSGLILAAWVWLA